MYELYFSLDIFENLMFLYSVVRKKHVQQKTNKYDKKTKHILFKIFNILD